MIAAALYNGAVELFLDDSGIDALIADLQSLRGISTHLHKMTPSWGGKELAEAVPHGETVNHLIIYSNAKASSRWKAAAPRLVMPAKAGIQYTIDDLWIPACAEMTNQARSPRRPDQHLGGSERGRGGYLLAQ